MLRTFNRRPEKSLGFFWVRFSTNVRSIQGFLERYSIVQVYCVVRVASGAWYHCFVYVRVCRYLVGELTDNSSDTDDPALPRQSRHHLLRCRLTPWEAAPKGDATPNDDADEPEIQKEKLKSLTPKNKLIVGEKHDVFFFF